MAPYLYTILAKMTICFVCFQPPNDYDIRGGDFEDDEEYENLQETLEQNNPFAWNYRIWALNINASNLTKLY